LRIDVDATPLRNKFRECENRWILKSGTFCQSRWGLASHVRYEADQLANMIQKRAGQDEHDGASDRLAGEYRDAPPLQKKIRERQLPSVSVAGCWQDWESHC